MALTKILRLSNSPCLHQCRRTFSTALNHTGVVFPSSINRDSKTCSKRLVGPFVRHFSSSPLVSDDMQKSVSEDLVDSVKSLHMDIESLRTEICALRVVVETIGKWNIERIVIEKDGGNGYVGESINRDEEVIKKSDFSEAMATQFNTNIVISQDNNNKVAEAMGDFSEEIRKSDTEGNNEKATEKMSDFSEAMATHFNSKIVISQDSKAEERISDVSEESDTGDNYGMVAGDFSEDIQESDTESNNNDKAAETMSDLSESMATHNAEIHKSDTEGDNETVSDGEQLQDPLLEEIESEISRALDFSRVSSQGVNLPDDFPFKLVYDVPGVASITLKRGYKLENIVVTVRPPSVFTPITTENYHYHKSSSFMMHLIVEIVPVNATERAIAFNCSVYGTGFFIDKVYGGDDDHEGLVFSDLNEELQKAFKKHLEERGIMPDTSRILLSYMLDKVNREKLRSLYKFKELVQA